MSVTISIRDVPNDVRDELAARAARSGRSLQEYLKGQLVDLAYTPLASDVLIEARRRAAHLPPVDYADLLAGRDADRR